MEPAVGADAWRGEAGAARPGSSFSGHDAAGSVSPDLILGILLWWRRGSGAVSPVFLQASRGSSKDSVPASQCDWVVGT